MGQRRKEPWDISKNPNYGGPSVLSEPALNATRNLLPKEDSIGSVGDAQNRIDKSYLTVTLWEIEKRGITMAILAECSF